MDGLVPSSEGSTRAWNAFPEASGHGARSWRYLDGIPRGGVCQTRENSYFATKVNEIYVELSGNSQRDVIECCESESDEIIDGFGVRCCKRRGGGRRCCVVCLPVLAVVVVRSWK
jgi:hypothetical protein